MKIETVIYTKRHNEGNYNHSEYSLTAAVEEGETAIQVINNLKAIVQEAIEGAPAPKVEPQTQSQQVEAVVAEPVVEEPKAKRTRGPNKKKTETPATDSFNGQDIPPVIVEQKSIAYDRSKEAHKNQLSIYLGNNFPGWKAMKPTDEIKAFTASLEGKPFLSESGEVLASFHETLASFFNA
jgi:hypothetical protein